MKPARLIASALARIGLGRPAPCRPAAAPVLSLGPSASLADIERVEGLMLRAASPAEIPVKHTFAPGVYLRTVTMPAGAQVIGHEHTTEHLNLVLAGRVRVLFEGRVEEITAPAVFSSGAGVRKVLQIIEETTWATVHPTTETDLEKLETMLIRKSSTFNLHAAQAATLPAGVTLQEAAK